jgi:hypothetical protein
MAMSEISAERKSYAAGPLGEGSVQIEPAPRRETISENGVQLTAEQLGSDKTLKGSQISLSALNSA